MALHCPGQVHTLPWPAQTHMLWTNTFSGEALTLTLWAGSDTDTLGRLMAYHSSKGPALSPTWASSGPLCWSASQTWLHLLAVLPWDLELNCGPLPSVDSVSLPSQRFSHRLPITVTVCLPSNDPGQGGESMAVCAVHL